MMAENKWKICTAIPIRWSGEHSLDQHLRQDPRNGREYLKFGWTGASSACLETTEPFRECRFFFGLAEYPPEAYCIGQIALNRAYTDP